MLSEYAVEPAAMGADWKTFKDLIDRFGVEKGRLISRLPKKWEKKVIQAAKESGVPDVRVASIIERLRDANRKVVDFSRSYDEDQDWLDNALREHDVRPFRAIISSHGGKPCPEALVPDDCYDEHALFSAPISQDVARTASDIAGALFVLASIAQEIDIVDPFFDLRPRKGDYMSPLACLLAALSAAGANPKAVRVHFRSHESRPTPEFLAQDASARVEGLLPPGYSLELYEWSEVQGGEDMHDRFFLTDLGGMMVGAGFSAEGPAETATFSLLDVDHAQRLRSRFSGTSTVYSRVGSAVRITSEGEAQLF